MGRKLNGSVVAHALIASGFVGALAFAQHGGGNGEVDEKAVPSDGITGERLLGMPDMSDPGAMREMMVEYTNLNRKSAGHEVLKRYEGEWDVVQRTMMPGMPEMSSEGRCTNRLAMDGKYLVGEYHGSFMGQPYEGMSVMGYDNFAKQFFSFWVDSMGTAPYLSHGGLSEDGRTIALVGEMNEPMTGELGKSARWVMTWVDEDTFTMEAQEIAYGEPMTVMSLEYTRSE